MIEQPVEFLRRRAEGPVFVALQNDETTAILTDDNADIGVDILLEQDANVRVILLPDGDYLKLPAREEARIARWIRAGGILLGAAGGGPR